MEHMIVGDGNPALYDTGFYNIGVVRPPLEDIGIGGNDPFGNPLSWSRQAKNAAVAPTTNLINVGPDVIGDARGSDIANTAGYQGNLSNRAPVIFPLKQAPFDHPALRIPNAHPIDGNKVIKDVLRGECLSVEVV
jgi:hypothetical protein